MATPVSYGTPREPPTCNHFAAVTTAAAMLLQSPGTARGCPSGGNLEQREEAQDT